MKNIIELNLILILLTSFIIYAQNNVPTVTNVSFLERTDSSFIIDINYDVNDADNDPMTVTVNVSTDAGQTWSFAVSNISGDYGAGIISGTGKHIVWNFGVEHPQFFTDQMQIKIVADDGAVSKSCPGLPTVTYAGKTYNTVQIGTQCWLRENLDVGSNNGPIYKRCYDNDPNNCDIYGGLYLWDDAMQYVTTEGAQGICPIGWHIPTYAEFQTLKNAVGGSAPALEAIGQSVGWPVSTNTSGFSGLFAGAGGYSGNAFFYIGQRGFFWSSTVDTVNENKAYEMTLGYYDIIPIAGSYKIRALSVRCLKD